MADRAAAADRVVDDTWGWRLDKQAATARAAAAERAAARATRAGEVPAGPAGARGHVPTAADLPLWLPTAQVLDDDADPDDLDDLDDWGPPVNRGASSRARRPAASWS